MKKHIRKLLKTLLLIAKLVFATVLLGWVLSQVHWGDYAEGTDGTEYAVVRTLDPADGRLEVRTGMLWWASEPALRPKTDFRPVGETDTVVRPGFLATLLGINVPLAICGSFGFLASLLVVAMRWRMLLHIVEIPIRRWEAIRLTFLGQFFNTIVPGTVGGDVVKAWYVSKHTPHKAAVLVSIFVDRVMGLAELTFMAGTMLGVVWIGGLGSFDVLRMPAIMVGVMAVLVAGVLLFVLSSRFRRVFHLQKLYRRLPIAHHLGAAGDAARLYRRRIGSLGIAFVMTMVAHIGWIGSLAMLGASLSLPTPWYSYFVFLPLIYIIGSVPITPGGVGLIEKFYVVFFATATCTPSMIMGLALLGRLVPIFWGLPGLIVALTGPKLPKADAMQAELALDAESEISEKPA
jgi:glycosyltransferase 2 family protein